MRFVTLTTEEEQQLKRLTSETQQITSFVRLKVIELSGQGYCVPELAKMFDRTQQTIRTYIHTFNKDRIEGLAPQPIPGRPAKLSWSQSDWQEILHHPPSEYLLLESHAQNWTLTLLKQYLKQYRDLDISRSSIGRYLSQAGISWKRARLKIHSPDPLYHTRRIST